MLFFNYRTYLKADIMVGDTRRREGPHGEKPSQHLSDNLKKYGLRIIRLKTGTPQRIDKILIFQKQGKIRAVNIECFVLMIINPVNRKSSFLSFNIYLLALIKIIRKFK